MPKWLGKIIRMIHYIPVRTDDWKRLRIALTQEELEEFKKYMQGSGEFIHAIRGLPIVVEDQPKNPMVKVERGYYGG